MTARVCAAVPASRGAEGPSGIRTTGGPWRCSPQTGRRSRGVPPGAGWIRPGSWVSAVRCGPTTA